MRKINVLIFPAGEVNSIELHDALSTCVNINLWGASSIDRHGGYVFKNYVTGLPLITEKDFLEEFNKLLIEKNIDIVFPTHDTVAMFFSENAEVIKAKIVVAEKETAKICRDKEKTYQVLSGAKFLPQLYKNFNNFPVFIKPKIGQGAVGARLIHNSSEIPYINLKDYIICEYLPGEEYTVDCLTDQYGKLIYVSPRSRQRLMAGISVSGKTEDLTEEIKYIAEFINNKLSFKGLWWFQIKKDKSSKWKLLEVSTRCAGSMCLTRVKGVNLPLLSIYILMGYDVQCISNKYNVFMDRTLISRYKMDYDYKKVYFDFDDTLIVNGCVNLKAIWFLYQCKNLNKRIILLTRHNKDINKTMQRYAISSQLFDDIICLDKSKEKVNYIDSDMSIFIDNAFQERRKVYEVLKIPVFDVDAIEMLMDWRA